MELRQNKYTVTIKNSEEKVFAVANQNQIYGLLIGQVSLIREIFPTMLWFRRWWCKERKKNGFPFSISIPDKGMNVIVTISLTNFLS